MKEFFSSLAPSLAGRSRARRVNDMARKAESLKLTDIHNHNQAALGQAALDAKVKSRQNAQVSKQFFKDRQALQLNEAERQTNQMFNDLQRVIGKEAAAGALAAMDASRGLTGSSVAAQYKAAQDFMNGYQDSLADRTAKAADWNYKQDMASLISSSFNSFRTDQAMVGLDYTQVKAQRQKEGGSVFKSIVKDAARGVAGYFGGSWALGAIDKVQGYENSYQTGSAIMQNSLDTLYGPGRVQLAQAKRPDLTSWGAGFGLTGKTNGALLDAFKGTKDNPNLFNFAQQGMDWYNSLGNQRAVPQLQGGYSLTSGGGIGGAQKGGFDFSNMYGMIQNLSRLWGRGG